MTSDDAVRLRPEQQARLPGPPAGCVECQGRARARALQPVPAGREAQPELRSRGPIPLSAHLDVSLVLRFRDPEGHDHPWPTGLPVTVRPEAAPSSRLRVGRDGLVEFRIERSALAFSLRFDFSEPTYFSVRETDRAVTFAPRDQVWQRAERERAKSFLVPTSWDMAEADWDVGSAPGWNGREFADLETVPELGSPAAPLALVLIPHWQFLRFEFFDRFYGPLAVSRSGHGSRRVTLPPFVLTGFRQAHRGSGAPVPDTESNWTIPAAGQQRQAPWLHRLQCLPWIIQRSVRRLSPGVVEFQASPKPDPRTVLEFRFGARMCVVSDDDSTRRYATVDPAALGRGGWSRLKHYDLPAVWRSTGYWARAGATGEVFERLRRGRFLRSCRANAPLAFCLDDIVLAIGDPAHPDAPLTPAPDLSADTVAIFKHSFKQSGAAARRTSWIGLWRPRADAPYVSNVRRAHGGRYLHDYPDWTRLVVAQGDLWEAFDRRTPDDGRHAAVGARAAVRWVDAMAPIPGVTLPSSSGPATAVPAAGSKIWARPAVYRLPFFALQPFAWQRYAAEEFPLSDDNWAAKGRADAAVLRCCDWAVFSRGDGEVGACFVYLRLAITFDSGPPHYEADPPDGWPTGTAWPPTTIQPSPLFPASGPLTETIRQARVQYINDAVRGIAERWIAGGIERVRPTFYTTDGGEEMGQRVIVFLQPVAGAAEAHFEVTVRPNRVPAWLPGRERAFMNGWTGVGTWYDADHVPAADGSYTTAHETGHAIGLPDEYIETVNYSADQPSVQYNLPGDPFELDIGISGDGGAMMASNAVVRNRHLWHLAELVRHTTGRPHEVRIGGYQYHLPAHPRFPDATLAYSPAAYLVNEELGPRGRFDMFAYLVGEDCFTKDVADVPFAGILVVAVKMRFSFAGFPPTTSRRDLLSKVKSRIDTAFGMTYWITAGELRPVATRLLPYSIPSGTRWWLMVSPRFEVAGEHDPIPPHTSHIVINVQYQFDGAAPASRWQRNNRAIDTAYVSGGADVWADGLFRHFGEMLGVGPLTAPVDPAALEPVVARLFAGPRVMGRGIGGVGSGPPAVAPASSGP